jgi:hypothetical protein
MEQEKREERIGNTVERFDERHRALWTALWVLVSATILAASDASTVLPDTLFGVLLASGAPKKQRRPQGV